MWVVRLDPSLRKPGGYAAGFGSLFGAVIITVVPVLIVVQRQP